MNTFTIIDSPIGGMVLVAKGEHLVGAFHEYHSPEPSPVVLGVPFNPHSFQVDVRTDADGTEGGERLAAVRKECESAAAVFQRTSEWLKTYFTGKVTAPPPYAIDTGTGFQREVWKAVAAVPYGSTRTYKDIAKELGNEAMGRAIGAAVRANPLSIIIPGHRIVGAKGNVTGYAAGVGVKRALLDLETTVADRKVA